MSGLVCLQSGGNLVPIRPKKKCIKLLLSWIQSNVKLCRVLLRRKMDSLHRLIFPLFQCSSGVVDICNIDRLLALIAEKGL